MKDKNGELLGCLVAIALLPVTTLLNGYALSVLWGWFIVTTFEARPLGVLPAIGVAMVVSFLTKQYDAYTDTTKSLGESIAISIVYSLLNPVFALLLGWILHSFM